MEAKFTPGPWEDVGPNNEHERCIYGADDSGVAVTIPVGAPDKYPDRSVANARLIAAAPELLEALREGRRAIGDHHAPNDCYATGPMTGNDYRDLVQCPACSFIAMYDAAISKATGEQA